jgi:hypothetical protein
MKQLPEKQSHAASEHASPSAPTGVHVSPPSVVVPSVVVGRGPVALVLVLVLVPSATLVADAPGPDELLAATGPVDASSLAGGAGGGPTHDASAHGRPTHPHAVPKRRAITPYSTPGWLQDEDGCDPHTTRKLRAPVFEHP